MIPLITAIVGVVSGVLGLINTTQANAQVSRIVEIKNSILEELNKGIGQADDSALETLYAKLQIELDAAQQQINLYLANRTSPGV